MEAANGHPSYPNLGLTYLCSTLENKLGIFSTDLLNFNTNQAQNFIIMDKMHLLNTVCSFVMK